MVQTAMQFALSTLRQKVSSKLRAKGRSRHRRNGISLVLASLSLQIPMLGAMLFAFSMRQVPFFHAEPSNSNRGILHEIGFGLRTFFHELAYHMGHRGSLENGDREFVHGMFSSEDLEVQAIVSTVSELELAPIIILTLLGIIMAPIAGALLSRQYLSFRKRNLRYASSNAY